MHGTNLSSTWNENVFQPCDNAGVKSADESLKRLGETVSAWMDRLQLSITDLHKQTGISRQTLYRVSKGEVWPTLDVLERLAEAFGITPGALIDGQSPGAAVVRSGAGAGKSATFSLLHLHGPLPPALLAIIGALEEGEIETRGSILHRLRRLEEIAAVEERIVQEEAEVGEPEAQTNERATSRSGGDASRPEGR